MLALQFKITDENELKFCDEGSFKVDYFKIGKIVAGQNLKIDAKGVFQKKVTGGKIHTQVLLGPIPIVNRVDELCGATSQIDLNCPLENERTVDKGFDIPKEVPGGSYTLRIDAIDQDNQKVTCATGVVHVHRE